MHVLISRRLDLWWRIKRKLVLKTRYATAATTTMVATGKKIVFFTLFTSAHYLKCSAIIPLHLSACGDNDNGAMWLVLWSGTRIFLMIERKWWLFWLNREERCWTGVDKKTSGGSSESRAQDPVSLWMYRVQKTKWKCSCTCRTNMGTMNWTGVVLSFLTSLQLHSVIGIIGTLKTTG